MSFIDKDFETDKLSRTRIATETDKNFFVEASAGSGKTSMLVNRMVAMVESGMEINKICAITFTKAAAGEFYDRFQRLLIERSKQSGTEREWLHPATEETRKRCADALKNIDLCFMGTIDSFCNMILSEHPKEAGILSNAAIVSESAVTSVYKQEYINIIKGKYGPEIREKAKLFHKINKNAQDVFARVMTFLMNNRNVSFRYGTQNTVDIDKAFEKEKVCLIKVLEFLKNHKELKYTKNKASESAWEIIDDLYNGISCSWGSEFIDILDNTVCKIKALRLLPEAVNHYENDLMSVFKLGGKKGGWLECEAEVGNLEEKLKNFRYDVSMSFMCSCTGIMENVLRNKGYMSYFDYLFYLRNMLKEDAENNGNLIRHIYGRHSYYLIDEFQDTNPLQAEVMFYLTAEHPNPSWTECKPRPGSLFIVGDPKQSIYRFRNADVSSFLKVKNVFEKAGGEILSLTRNFRSNRKLCEYFNTVFLKMMQEETENQSKYEPIPLHAPCNDEFQGVYKYTIKKDSSDSEEISDIIDIIVGNENFKIHSNGEDDSRKIRYDDIMIITDDKRKIWPIIKELESRNIPVRAEGVVPFIESDALREISMIYSAAADTSDLISLYGALTGEIIGINEEDMMHFKTKGGSLYSRAKYVSDSSEMDDTVRHVLDERDRIWKMSSDTSSNTPASLFEKILDEYRIFEYVPAKDIEVVYYALELLRKKEIDGALHSLKDGSLFISELVDGNSGEERCLDFSSDKNSVHIANLHKVKGLQAPVVILAGPNIKEGQNNGPDYRIVHKDEGTEGYIFKLVQNNYPVLSTSAFEDEKVEEEAALEAEKARLIYVAATRAQNVLIICEGIADEKEEIKRASKWKRIIEPECQDISDIIEGETKRAPISAGSVSAEELYNQAEQKSSINRSEVKERSFDVKNPSRLRMASKISSTLNIDENEGHIVNYEEGKSERSRNNLNAALIGTMLHRLMEMLVVSRDRLDKNTIFEEIFDEFSTHAAELHKDEYISALKKVYECIHRGGYDQSSGIGKDILCTLLNADEVYCEIPFCYVDTGTPKAIWNGIMDVVYCKDDNWHIVDYKTNADGTNLDIKYEEQLNAYTKAFKLITGIDADAKIYHIDI